MCIQTGGDLKTTNNEQINTLDVKRNIYLGNSFILQGNPTSVCVACKKCKNL